MGSIGIPELLIIMVVILLLFGAKRIPEIAGSMGKGIREFKKNINEATREINADTKPPLESDTQSRLTAAELEQRRRTAEEAERAQPKRLL
jgi:sec-independent protein translocase protein TatA